MYEVRKLKTGKIWNLDRDLFSALVYVPDNDVPGDAINLGMDTPYLIVMPESKLDDEGAAAFAENSGLATIAAKTGGSVVFVTPNNEGGWQTADAELFKDLIAQSKIGAVYKDGVLIDIDRFHQRPTSYYIRGAVFKTFLYGFGASADYIARNLLTKVEGQYLWGPGEITPAAVSLENLTVIPKPDRRDIPVVSVGNSEEINAALHESCDHICVIDEADYEMTYSEFMWKYKRWCGELNEDPDYEALGMVNEYGYEVVKTTPDNYGEFEGTEEHKVGYMVWYNKGLLDKGPVSTLIASHGGGDSALYIAKVSGWWEIAHKYNFLLIAVENHTSVTASETMEMIDKIKAKYNIDENRLYASGFSMGGCKSWDFCQEFPERFAALAPMDATFEVGLNVFGKSAPRTNTEISVPIFYAGGAITPLPELPFQADKCTDRIRYVFELNKAKTPYNVKFEERENWVDPIWGIAGDRIEEFRDESRDAVLTVNYFASEDGVERIALGSVDNQGHECRRHTCEQAWLFMSKFSLDNR